MADVPFGASFGNPRQYMGSSGIQDMMNDYKKFGVAQLVEKSGLKDLLNEKLGVPGQGYKPPAGYVPSGGVMPPANYGFSAPQGIAPMDGGSGLGLQQNTQQGLTMPSASGLGYQGAKSPYDMAYKADASQIGQQPQESTGSHLMNAMKDFNISGYTNPSAQHDIPVNPNENYGYTQKLATGNEYQQVPGFGKLQKVAQAFTGFMG